MKRALALILVALLGLAGCRSYGYHIIDHQHDPVPTIDVEYGPPRKPPQPNEMTPSPGPRHVWVPAHWTFSCNKYRWREGAWHVPPRQGATFAAGHHNGRHGLWVPPHWR